MKQLLETAAVVLGAAAVLFLLHRLCLLMEARGWIYYRKNRKSGTAIGNAILELQSMVEPSKKHIIEATASKKKPGALPGDPP